MTRVDINYIYIYIYIASDGFGHAVAYIIVLLQLVKLGEHPYVALIFSLSTYWCCFLSYYEHRQTGTLRWAEGQMGDLEGYLLLVLGSLFSGIFGTSFLNSNILIWIVPDHSGIYLSFGFFYLLIGFKTYIYIYIYPYHIFNRYITMGYLSLKSVFTHPKVDKKSALCELLPISIITLFGLLWGFTNQFSGNVGLSLVALGWCCCHILLKISITICWQVYLRIYICICIYIYIYIEYSIQKYTVFMFLPLASPFHCLAKHIPFTLPLPGRYYIL